MPSIASYTPFESLLIFQSVAIHGTSESSFDTISKSLNSNEHIRSNENYDARRLNPAGLQHLYNELLRQEIKSQRTGEKGRDGYLDVTEPNSRKRKASTPPTPSPQEASKNAELMGQLVEKLYARYKDQVTEQIKADEDRYDQLCREIEELEAAEKAAPNTNGVTVSQAEGVSKEPAQTPIFAPSLPRDPSTDSIPIRQPALHQHGNTEPVSVGAEQNAKPKALPKPDISLPAQTPPSSSVSTYPPPRPPSQQIQPSPSPGTQPSPLAPSHVGPASPAFPPPPGAGHSSFANVPGQRAPIPPAQGYPPRYSPAQAQPGSPVILPPPPGMQPQAMSPMQPPGNATPMTRRGSSNTGPLPQGQYSPSPQSYPQFSHYAPPWTGQQSPPQPYPHLTPYANSPYPPQQFQGHRAIPSAGTPAQSTFPQPYGSPAPGPYAQPFQRPASHGPPQQHPYQYASAQGQSAWPAPTPMGQRKAPQTPQPSTNKSNSPWKSIPSTVTQQMPQPSREREISPIGERENYRQRRIEEIKTRAASFKAETSPRTDDNVKTKGRGRGRNRRVRGDSTASSAAPPGSRSRSHSAASSSDTRQGIRTARHGGGRSIKPEPPSTPVPMPSDNEQSRASTRRRGNTLQSVHDNLSRSTNRPRRGARDSASSSVPPPHTPQGMPAPSRPTIDPNLVATSRNFSKIAQPLINDILRDKHATIFQKPITEGMAPGYKNLIYRPQDLKSIKTAVATGNKVVLAAMEEQGLSGNTPVPGDTASPAATPSGAAAASSRSITLLKKSEDLVPPKAIVNPPQLEKELIRIFANAIMFNPLPKEERGFGHIRFRSGQDANADNDSDAEQEEEDDEAAVKGTWQAEEGALIHNTREMAERVIRMVNEWREAEQGKSTGLMPFGEFRAPSLRGGSITTSEVYGPDESSREDNEGGGGGGEDGESVGGPRKRRKIGD
ncbi:MAG: hypothetical protein Q9227_002574 [Pyrenula ochraceoflavens]